ncbi:hypothetical protein LOAG_07371 [Loa loa]|uniref:Uncharacterized protein n=1 Tax=Loa loa TaxID=7209 RepID=A0A1S0TXL7_LOALO|nr:hypothetical protein LOAG_07371 [Loa loa]EFO21119.1 hypothetical protein LOAG_07371 [Loa loa]
MICYGIYLRHVLFFSLRNVVCFGGKGDDDDDDDDDSDDNNNDNDNDHDDGDDMFGVVAKVIHHY